MSYYSGQGKVYVATRDIGGNPGGFRWLGNVPSLELSIETDKFEHKESYTGNRAIDVTVVTETKASLTFTIEDFSIENLALGLYGSNTQVTGTTVAAEPLEVTLSTEDRVYRLEHPNNISAITVTTLTEEVTPGQRDGDYRVDVTNGTLLVFSGTATASHTVAYTFDTYMRTDVFTTTSSEVWLRFEGLSTLDSGQTTLIDAYRVAIDPMSGYQLINDEIGSAEITGSILADTTRVAGNQFFQQINIDKV